MQEGAAVQYRDTVTTKDGPAWRRLYRLGGISSLVVGTLYIIGLLSLLFLGLPPSDGDAYFRFLAGNKLLFRTLIGIFALATFLQIPIILALYTVLSGVNRTLMLIATALFGLFIVLDLGVNTVNLYAQVLLTDKYMTATGDAQRVAYIAAADLAREAVSVGITLLDLVISVGAILIGLTMLRGVFGKGIAYLSISSGIVGIGATVAVPGLGVGFLISLIAAVIWFLAVGSKLYKLG